MKRHITEWSVRLLMVLALGLFVGCDQETSTEDEVVDANGTGPDTSLSDDDAADEHAHGHDVPLTEAEKEQLREDTATYETAVEHIHTFRDTIHQELTDGDPEHAHRALDNVDLVLERLPELAAADVPQDQQATVTATAERLRELFNQVHANIDAGNEADYESVSDEIDEGIETLEGLKADATDADASDDDAIDADPAF
jgi:hypothetical protein